MTMEDDTLQNKLQMTKKDHKGEKARQDILSPKEVDTLALILEGATTKDIADKLSISTDTVEPHLCEIYKKINATNRFQAALWAAKHL